MANSRLPNYLSSSGTSGRTAYGTVPAAISTPSPYEDLSAVYPNLAPSQAQLSKNVLGELQGQLSPETINAIRNQAATFGVTSGMPGSQFAANQGLRNLGLATEQIQGKGLQDYLNAITGISKTQTVAPELQSEIASRNAMFAAAPDPAMAAAEQERKFQEYLDAQSSPAGGTKRKHYVYENPGAPWVNYDYWE